MSSPRIAIFGSSMNPPTQGGHVELVKYFANLFDQVWVMPVYTHVFDTKRNLAPFELRMEMATLAFKDLENVTVKDSEREMYTLAEQKLGQDNGVRLGTVDLIKYLQTCPGLEHQRFSLILGGDTFVDLNNGKWRNGETLFDIVDIHVVNRPGVDAITEQQVDSGLAKSKNVTLHTISTLTDASSTQARGCTEQDRLVHLVGSQVAQYIANHKMYMFSQL